MNCAPVGFVPVGIISPNKPQTPWIRDERVPRPRNPRDVMNEAWKKSTIEKAKNTPENQRTCIDYLILAYEKMKELQPPVIYYNA